MANLHKLTTFSIVVFASKLVWAYKTEERKT